MTHHPLHSALYDPVMAVVDHAGLGARRRQLVQQASGRVLEIGGGTGRNLPLYQAVEGVVVVEPDAGMRRRLLDRLAAAPVPVEIHDTTLEASGLPDRSFDTVVSSLVLCTVADQASALSHILRLLKPDGRFLFLEHVRAAGWPGRLQALATPAWSRLTAGCHLDRPTLHAMREAGFAVTDCDRWGLLVQGVARPSRRRSEVAAR